MFFRGVPGWSGGDISNGCQLGGGPSGARRVEVGPTNFFVRVSDLNPIKPTIEAGDVVVPERKTFYGAREIVVRAPCGTIVTFAEFEE